MSQQYLRKELKILSWNLQLTPFFPLNKSTRINHITQNIKELNPDIICFQEVYTFLSYLKLKKKLASDYPFFTSLPVKGTFKIVNSGLVIFSKYPIRSEYFKPFPKLIGSDNLYTKGIQSCTIQKTNILNLNFQSGEELKASEIRKQNITQLFNSVKHYVNPNIIFCGDFKMSLDSIEFKELKNKLKIKKPEAATLNKSFILIVEGSRLEQISHEEVTNENSIISTIDYPVEIAEDVHQLK